jgi:hypothetical protein
MILLLVLGSVLATLQPELAELATRARSMAKEQRRTHSARWTYESGDHNLGGVRFKLDRRLSGDLSGDVAGYAMGHQVLAIIAPEIEARRVFIESATQELFEVREVIIQDEEVTFYRIHRKDPLAVFTNLEFQVSQGEADIDRPAMLGLRSMLPKNCDFTVENESFGYGREGGAQRIQTGSEIESPDHPDVLSLGADLAAVGAVAVRLNGVANLELEYSLELTGRAELAFNLTQSQSSRASQYEGNFNEIPVWSWQMDILGFNLSLSVTGFIGESVKHFSLNFSQPLAFGRNMSLKARFSGSLSTEGGHKGIPYLLKVGC